MQKLLFRLTIATTALLLLWCSPLWGQQLSESYYRENPSWMDAELWAGEGEYMLLPSNPQSPFEEWALYGFSFVDYSSRGERYSSLVTRLGALDVHNPLQRYPDYALLSLLRRAPVEQSHRLNGAHNDSGADLAGEYYSPSPLEQAPTSHLRLQLSTRTYRGGVGYRHVMHRGDTVALSLGVGARGGDDANIEGLYSNECYLWLGGERQWHRELDHRVQMAFMVAPTERSQRSWNTEEIFALAGDAHYNSYWGYQQGRVRSSRVRRTTLPALYASWDIDDRYILSRINFSTFIQAGRTSRTSLSWEGASNPLPDYYAYLPSYQADPEAATLLGEVWRTHNEAFTQIDFSKLYEANGLTPEAAPYGLMEERSDLFSAQWELSGALLGNNLRRIGLRGGYHSSREYITPADMFGAEALVEGCYDPYDHTPTLGEWALYGTLSQSLGLVRLSGSVELGNQRLSYLSHTTHHSACHNFTLFRSRLVWSATPTPTLSGGGDLYYHHTAPYWSDLYGAAQGAMSPNRWAGGEGRLGSNLWGRWEVGPLTLHATLYAHWVHNQSLSQEFWNDRSATYATLLAGSLSTLSLGGQLSGELPLGRSLRMEAHLGIASNRYTSDGIADIVAFDTPSPIVQGTRLRTRGMVSSSTPGFVGATKLTWFAPSGWMVGAEASLATRRYMEPSLLLCSDYILTLQLTPEEQQRLTDQPSLGTATNLSIFVYRRWGHLTISASVRNLLNNTSAYRAGYQPSRLRLTNSDTLLAVTPHEPRYQHIYPRHIYLSVGYEF